jgi:hypothetical protein
MILAFAWVEAYHTKSYYIINREDMPHEQITGHENGVSEHDLALHGIGAVAMHETEQETIRTPEISAERQATFVEKNPEGTYYLFCGDDRDLTDESADTLRSPEVEDPNTAIRYYGGAIGLARIAATVIVAQYGPEALSKYEGSFEDFTKDQINRISSTSNVRVGVHSAEGSEGNTTHLDDASEKDIACAYAAGAQKVTQLNADPAIIELGKRETRELFGDDNQTELVDIIADANGTIEKYFSRSGEVSFNVDRNGLKNLDVPVAILRGSHAPVASTIVELNFHADKVSNPRTGREAGLKSYVNDITQAAEIVKKANSDLQLQPRLIVAAMLEDIRAVREALASSEGKHAEDLRVERYGSPEAAIAYLESLQ